jgi:spore coat protein U-like protein
MSAIECKSIRAGVGLGILALAMSVQPAAAATGTATFTVSATVQATCSVVTSPLAFGAYSGAVLAGTTTVSVTCTNTTPYSIGLNAGIATGATVTTRKMTGPSSSLISYGMYSDAGHTVNWGNTPATDTVAGTGIGSVQVSTVYGQMPAGQLVTPGAYSDTITATVTY